MLMEETVSWAKTKLFLFRQRTDIAMHALVFPEFFPFHSRRTPEGP